MTSDPGWMILLVVFVMSVSIPPSNFDSDQSSTGISKNIKINFPIHILTTFIRMMRCTLIQYKSAH